MGLILLIAGGFGGWRSGYFDAYALASLVIFAAFLEAVTVFFFGQIVTIEWSIEVALDVLKDWLVLCIFGLVGFLFGMWLKKKQIRDFGDDG